MFFRYHETLMRVIISKATPANHSRKFQTCPAFSSQWSTSNYVGGFWNFEFIRKKIATRPGDGHGQILISWALVKQSSRAKNLETWRDCWTIWNYLLIFAQTATLIHRALDQASAQFFALIPNLSTWTKKRLDSHWWKSISSPVSSLAPSLVSSPIFLLILKRVENQAQPVSQNGSFAVSGEFT